MKNLELGLETPIEVIDQLIEQSFKLPEEEEGREHFIELQMIKQTIQRKNNPDWSEEDEFYTKEEDEELFGLVFDWAKLPKPEEGEITQTEYLKLEGSINERKRQINIVAGERRVKKLKCSKINF